MRSGLGGWRLGPDKLENGANLLQEARIVIFVIQKVALNLDAYLFDSVKFLVLKKLNRLLLSPLDLDHLLALGFLLEYFLPEPGHLKIDVLDPSVKLLVFLLLPRSERLKPAKLLC